MVYYKKILRKDGTRMNIFEEKDKIRTFENPGKSKKEILEEINALLDDVNDLLLGSGVGAEDESFSIEDIRATYGDELDSLYKQDEFKQINTLPLEEPPLPSQIEECPQSFDYNPPEISPEIIEKPIPTNQAETNIYNLYNYEPKGEIDTYHSQYEEQNSVESEESTFELRQEINDEVQDTTESEQQSAENHFYFSYGREKEDDYKNSSVYDIKSSFEEEPTYTKESFTHHLESKEFTEIKEDDNGFTNAFALQENAKTEERFPYEEKNLLDRIAEEAIQNTFEKKEELGTETLTDLEQLSDEDIIRRYVEQEIQSQSQDGKEDDTELYNENEEAWHDNEIKSSFEKLEPSIEEKVEIEAAESTTISYSSEQEVPVRKPVIISVDCERNDERDIAAGGSEYLGYDFIVDENQMEEMGRYIAYLVQKHSQPLHNMSIQYNDELKEEHIWTVEQIEECIAKGYL